LYTARELEHQFNDSGASVLVVLAELLPQVEPVLARTGIQQVNTTSVFDLSEAQPLQETKLPRIVSLTEVPTAGADRIMPRVAIGMNGVVWLQYTGGTTGPAKGAILTHGNIFAGARRTADLVQIDPDKPDIVLAPMPLTTSMVLR
jgi:long-chain acyl-CoA synthetase